MEQQAYPNDPKNHYLDPALVDRYDSTRFGGLKGRAFAYLQARHLRMFLGRVSPRRVLDVATGTGRILLAMPADLNVCIGADTSIGMLLKARPRVAAFQRNASFMLMDARSLGVMDRSLDCVTCVKLFHLIAPEEAELILTEMTRVTRRFVIFSLPINKRFGFGHGRVTRFRRSSAADVLRSKLSGLGLGLSDFRFTLRWWSDDCLVLAHVDQSARLTAAAICAVLNAAATDATHSNGAPLGEGDIVVERVRGTTHCFRVEAKYHKATKQYFAKICPRYNDLNGASVELQQLRFLHRYFGESSNLLTVPRPVGLVVDSNAILTEYAPGVTLLQILKRELSWNTSSRRRSEILEVFGRVGEWLRRFHTSGDSTEGQDFFTQFAKVTRHDMRTLSGSLALRWPLERFRHAWDYVAAGSAGVDGTSVRLHGDFGPPNILVDEDGRLTVVDLGSLLRGSPAFDVSTFLVAIHVMAYKVGVLLFRRAFIKELQTRFLRSYSQTYFTDEFSDRLIPFYCACALVHACAQQTRTLQRAPVLVRWIPRVVLHLWYRRQLNKQLHAFEMRRKDVS